MEYIIDISSHMDEAHRIIDAMAVDTTYADKKPNSKLGYTRDGDIHTWRSLLTFYIIDMNKKTATYSGYARTLNELWFKNLPKDKVIQYVAYWRKDDCIYNGTFGLTTIEDFIEYRLVEGSNANSTLTLEDRVKACTTYDTIIFDGSCVDMVRAQLEESLRDMGKKRKKKYKVLQLEGVLSDINSLFKRPQQGE